MWVRKFENLSNYHVEFGSVGFCHLTFFDKISWAVLNFKRKEYNKTLLIKLTSIRLPLLLYRIFTQQTASQILCHLRLLIQPHETSALHRLRRLYSITHELSPASDVQRRLADNIDSFWLVNKWLPSLAGEARRMF